MPDLIASRACHKNKYKLEKGRTKDSTSIHEISIYANLG